ncbi:MAG: hypothetical protein LQ343_003093 [Gyalolechia ehrenbergii]|nr:MAG: hypothetical protein LQ343_003093 [Gyalolechia ehrenbergii]
MERDPERADKATVRSPWLLDFRSSNGFILATVCVAIFTDAFLYGVVVPVLPFSLRERSGVPEDQAICGWVADRTSNRSITFYTGLLILAAATVIFGLAKASWVLLISRLLQGLSAAITYTVGLALLVDTVGRENIGQWMGTALSSSSFGLIVSPLLGGIVYAKAGYMSVFAMALALIVVDIVMRLIMIEKKTAVKYEPAEAVTPPNGFYGTFTDQQPSDHGHVHGSPPSGKPQDDSDNAPLLANGSKEPPRKKWKLPTILVLLSMPRLLAAIYGIFVNVSILAAFDGVLSLYVKKLFGWDSLNAGLIFLCLAVPALTGFTLILIVSPVAADLSAVVEAKEKADPDAFGPGGAYGQAFALFNCSMAAATLFGPVVAGALVERHGWGVMTAAMGVFAFSGAIPAFFYTGGWIFNKKA